MGVKQSLLFQTLKDYSLGLLLEKKFYVELWGILIIIFMLAFSLEFLKMGNM